MVERITITGIGITTIGSSDAECEIGLMTDGGAVIVVPAAMLASTLGLTPWWDVVPLQSKRPHGVYSIERADEEVGRG